MSEPTLKNLLARWKREMNEARIRGPKGRIFADGMERCIDDLQEHIAASRSTDSPPAEREKA